MMSNPQKKDQILDENNNILNFPTNLPILSTNTKGTDEDWLSKLNVGIIFLAYPKTLNVSKVFLAKYEITNKSSKSTELMEDFTGEEKRVWVNPSEFCKVFGLFEILENLAEEAGGHKDEVDYQTPEGEEGEEPPPTAA